MLKFLLIILLFRRSEYPEQGLLWSAMILAILAIPFVFSLVIGLHELGHAVVARWFNIKVTRISIGFGRPWFTWTSRHGHTWVLARWPLGGAVHLLNSRIEPVLPTEEAVCFDKKPVWVRCLVLAAGGVANALTAFLALILMYLLGYQQAIPVIHTVIPHSMAAKAGMHAGDRFISIGKEKTEAWQTVGMALIMNMGQDHVPIVIVNTEGHLFHSELDLRHWRYHRENSSLLGVLGIQPVLVRPPIKHVHGQSLLGACTKTLQKSWALVHFFLVMLKQIIIGVIPLTTLLGPFGLLALSFQSFAQGISVFLYFIANLSLAVGLINLCPIPGLDGGSIVYALVERCRGKPVSIALEVLLHRLAMIAFAMLLVQLVMNDVQHYVVTSTNERTIAE